MNKPKINKRLSYFTNVIKRKDLRLWAPTNIDPDSTFGQLLSYIEFVENIQQIDKSLYENNFATFYAMEIEKYDNAIKKGANFCSSDKEGGVNEEYIVHSAEEETNATLLSVQMNPDNSINEIYALVTFRVSESKKAIKIHTLCGNKALPPSGEGTRLMKMLERVGNEFGLYKILLNPLDTAVPFYAQHKYRPLGEDESQETDYDSDEIQMQKNIRAQKHWGKLRTAVKLRALMSRSKKASQALELKRKYLRQKESRTPLKRTMSTRARPIIPGESLKSDIKFIPKPNLGIPSKVIVPGESFAFSNKKSALLETASKTMAQRAISQKRGIEMLSRMSKSSKSSKSNNKTKKRV